MCARGAADLVKSRQAGSSLSEEMAFSTPPEMFDPQLKVDEEFQLRIRTSPCCRMRARGAADLVKNLQAGSSLSEEMAFSTPPEMFDPQLKVDEEFQLRIRTSPCCRMCARSAADLVKSRQAGSSLSEEMAFSTPPEMFDPQLKVDEEFQLRIRTSPCCRMCARGAADLVKSRQAGSSLSEEMAFSTPPEMFDPRLKVDDEFSIASGPPPVAECVLGAQLTLSKVAKRAQAFLRKWRFRPPLKCSIHS